MIRKRPFHLTMPVLLSQADPALPARHSQRRTLHLTMPVLLSQADPTLPARHSRRRPLHLTMPVLLSQAIPALPRGQNDESSRRPSNRSASRSAKSSPSNSRRGAKTRRWFQGGEAEEERRRRTWSAMSWGGEVGRLAGLEAQWDGDHLRGDALGTRAITGRAYGRDKCLRRI